MYRYLVAPFNRYNVVQDSLLQISKHRITRIWNLNFITQIHTLHIHMQGLLQDYQLLVL